MAGDDRSLPLWLIAGKPPTAPRSCCRRTRAPGWRRIDLVHFLLQAVDRLPLSPFAVNHKGPGNAQHPPPTMLALLLSCCAHGVFQFPPP